MLRAVEIMLVVPKAADDMMNVGRLNGFPGKLTAQGKLIKQELLLFCDLTPVLASLDSSTMSSILAQFEANSKQQFSSLNGDNNINSGGSKMIDFNGQMIGSCSMTDEARIILNHILNHTIAAPSGGGGGSSNLANQNKFYQRTLQWSQLPASLQQQLKMRERHTFLFEQRIIFGETFQQQPKNAHNQRSTSTKSSSSAAQLAGSGPYSMSGVGVQFGGAGPYQSVGAYNSHPCYAHSHGLQGQVEFCCHQADCSLARAAADASVDFCDRLAATLINYRHNNHDLDPDASPTSDASAQSLEWDEWAARVAGAHAEQQRHHHHAPSQWNPMAIQGGYSTPSYEYKHHLSINKVTLIEKPYGSDCDLERLYKLLGPENLDLETEACRFILKSRDPNQGNVIYLLQAGCAHDRDDWTSSIRSMLECQLDFLRALQSPIAYQRGLTQEG